jgi:hypothetical protein
MSADVCGAIIYPSTAHAEGRGCDRSLRSFVLRPTSHGVVAPAAWITVLHRSAGSACWPLVAQRAALRQVGRCAASVRHYDFIPSGPCGESSHGRNSHVALCLSRALDPVHWWRLPQNSTTTASNMHTRKFGAAARHKSCSKAAEVLVNMCLLHL